MTIDLKAIRDVASVTSDSERMQFKPSTVIALLDRLETAEKALAEPAVEPVAEVYQRMTGGNSFPGTGIRWLDGVDLIPAGTKLYTSPPPPAEVPLLSDDEIGALVRVASKGGTLNRDGSTSQRIARAIEQAVRQKAGLK